MMEIFEFIHLIEISRLVEISDAQKFSGLWKPMYESFTRLGFLRTKTKLVIWSVKSWTLNFWSLIWNYLISSWSSWSLILLIFDLWWTLIRWSVKRLDLWSFDLSWSLSLIFWSHWSLNCDLSFQLELRFVERNHRNTERLQ